MLGLIWQKNKTCYKKTKTFIKYVWKKPMFWEECSISAHPGSLCSLQAFSQQGQPPWTPFLGQMQQVSSKEVSQLMPQPGKESNQPAQL
jgi:hypothetical protein